MRIDNANNFYVGEPWNTRAINNCIGSTTATSQDTWPGHPGKVLGTRQEWIEKYPYTTRVLANALLRTSHWIDASEANKCETTQILAHRTWLNIREGYLTTGMLGEYDNDADHRWQDPHVIRFFHDGEVDPP